MNYYPNNFYSNYPYGNTYGQYSQQMQPQSPAGLQGKIVDGEEMVKATEVPFGSYGIFPKADLSEVYIKTWNNNGTTQITSYRPIYIEQKEEVDVNALLLERMKEIESKLDNIVSAQQSTSKVVVPEKRKELNVSAY